MSVIIAYKQLYETQAFREGLRVENPLFLRKIDVPVLLRLLNTLDGQWSNGGRYYGPMKHGQMATDI